MADRLPRFGMILMDGAPALLRAAGTPLIFSSPVTVGLAGSPDRVERACSTMSPGKVAASLGTANVSTAK